MSVQTVGTASGAATLTGASTDALDATYGQAAIEQARTAIQTVPGSGAIRGVWHYSGNTYAFRDDTAGVFCRMFKSTTSGWSQIDLGQHIRFDAGTVAFTEGDTLSGGTSGASAVIQRVCLQAGAFGDSDAVGTLVLGTVAGAFLDNETITDVAGGSATSNGSDISTLLTAGGRFEFITDNFGGHTGTRRMYGVDGVSKGFEYDGTVFVPIYTGMTTDTPKHVTAHHKHLFYQFTGGSNQHSSIGDPYGWSAVTGASEISTGDDLVGFSNLPGETLAIFSRNQTNVLYGTSSSDWQLNEHSGDAGAIEWSLQDIGWPIFLDDRGVMDMRSTLNYGDFKSATLSELVQPLIDTKKSKVVDSMRVKSKDQYRLFFSDNTVLTMGIAKGKPTGFFSWDLGKVVRVSCAVEDSSGDEILFFGSDDGYIYQMDKGTSLDGSAVLAFARLPYNNVGMPRRRKRFSRAVLEVDAQVSTALNFQQSFDYGDPDAPSPFDQAFTVAGGGGFWEEATWDDFTWDDQIVGSAHAYLDGTGFNMSMLIQSTSIYEKTHTLQALTYYYRPRGLQR